MSVATMTGAATAPTQLIQAKKATYAYRRFGHGAARPLLFLQHFVGTLDNWDLQRFYADRMHANTTPIKSSHAVIVSHAAEVSHVIVEAARSSSMQGEQR